MLYHSIDIDGYMSAAIVKHFYNTQRYCSVCDRKLDSNSVGSTTCCGGITTLDNIDFIGYNYGDPIPDLSEYDKVIMCDISFSKDIMRELRRDKFNHVTGEDNLIFIDHHLSAIKDSELEFYSDCSGLRDTKYSACELTWQYFFPNKPMPEIVRLLGLYDSFRNKGTDEEQKVLEFQYGARQVIWNYETAYDRLLETIKFEKALLNIHLSGASIYDYLCTEAKQTYKNGFKITLFGEDYITYQFICINKERFNPINFGIDYHKDGYDGCACFHYANGMWNFSLYNDNGKVDCSAIAKQYGGGGHLSASGFRIKNITQIINE